MFDEPNKGQKISGHIMFDQVIKSIAGFANSTTGGSLLVGVHDVQVDSKTNLHSVTNDFYKIVEKQFGSEDKFLLRFGDTLKKVFKMLYWQQLQLIFLKLNKVMVFKKILTYFCTSIYSANFYKIYKH